MIVDFLLLLLYSLLPGLAKIFDQQAFFLLNLPIIFFFLFKYKNKIVLRKIDSIFLIFFICIILQTIVSFFLSHINQNALFMGVFMYLIPFLGFFYSKAVKFESFAQNIFKIVLIHAFIGVLLYPAFGLGGYFESVYLTLNEGVAFGRMSSVSGSLGFANLMFVGFVITYHLKNNKLPLILLSFCLVFSLQRSSWLAALLSIMISTIISLKLIGFKKIALFSTFLILLIPVLLYLSSNADFDILFSRFSEFGKEAASERSEQWVGGINNFLSFPLGAGVGQVGQISARYDNNPLLHLVPDGDFLRVLSETGIFGLFFYLFIIILLIYSLSTLKSYQRNNIIIISLIVGYSLQMIGSNITEFYFTNFIYWIFLGYFFNLIQIEKNKFNNLILEENEG